MSSRSRPSRARSGVAIVAALALLSGSGGCRGGGSSAGEAQLHVDGRAVVTEVGGTSREVTRSTTLHRGDEVESVEGTIVVDLANGAHLEGRSGRAGHDPTRLVLADPPELLAGDLLLTAPRGGTVRAAGTRVELASGEGDTGAVRITRTLAMGATAYRGAVIIDSAGERRLLPALRTMEVSALGRPPAAGSPLQYDPVSPDPWDLRFLGDAIDLGRSLDAISRAYTGSLGRGVVRDATFYATVLPDLDGEPAFPSKVNPAMDAGEVLVGAAITSLGRRGDFASRWDAVFGFRVAGAAWGLVALDQGVSRAPLLARLADAVNASPLGFAATGPLGPAPVAPGAGGGSGSGGAGGPGGPAGPTTTTVPPNAPPPTTPPGDGLVPPTGTPLDPVLDDVDDVLSGLLPP